MRYSQERRIMRLVLVAAFLAMASASTVKDFKIEKKKSTKASAATEQALKFYHENVGIPEARRLKQAEKEASDIQPFVAGGEPSPANAYPYLVGVKISLTTGGLSVCSSSMLTNTKAVTAAHCWWDGKHQASEFELVFGSLRLFSGGVRVDTDEVETHADWNPSTTGWDPDGTGYDIALVTFKHVEYTEAIKSVLLPSGAMLDDDFAGKMAQAVGFGKTGDDSPITGDQVQNHVTLEVITNEICQETWGSSAVTASNLCTSGEGGKGPCGGDSGGPLTITSEEKTVLIGVNSFVSARGCEAGRPAVYSRVTSFATWIQDRISD